MQSNCSLCFLQYFVFYINKKALSSRLSDVAQTAGNIVFNTEYTENETELNCHLAYFHFPWMIYDKCSINKMRDSDNNKDFNWRYNWSKVKQYWVSNLEN